MKTRQQLLALLAALPLAGLSLTACGGGDPAALTQEGIAALDKGDPAAAEAKLAAALAELEPGSAEYMKAKTAYLRAKAHADGAAATTEFLAFAESTEVDAQHYRGLVQELTAENDFTDAVRVLEAGKQAHPDYDKWDELIQMAGDKAKNAGDAEALESLKGLGYVGD